MSRNALSKNEELRKGDYLISNNREFKAVFQEDGNFAIYGWKQIWSAETASTHAHRLCMQQDCNFVMYQKNNDPVWKTNSAKSQCNMCNVRLRNDGVLCVEREGEEIWCSLNSRGMKGSQ